MLMNDEFILSHSKKLAERVRVAAKTKDAQVRLAYELALSRQPTDEERNVALVFLETQSLEAFTHVVMNLNEFVYLR